MANQLEHDWRQEFKRLEGAYAPATLKSYVADVDIFVNWCNAHNISPFPASVSTVCQFLEAGAGMQQVKRLDQHAGAPPCLVKEVCIKTSCD